MKPECKPIRPLLSAYFDGETTASEANLVRQHLATCQDCPVILDDYRRMRTQFNRFSHPVAPSELRRAVLAEVHAVRTGTATRRGFSPGLRLGTLVAGIAVLVVIVALAALILRPASSSTFEVAQVVSNEDGTRVTFSQPVDPKTVEKNLQITDASGQKVEADVTKIDDKTVQIKLKLPEGDNSGPLNIAVKKDVTDKNGSTLAADKTFTVVPPTATSTRQPSTNTPRPPQTTAPVGGQTVAANNPSPSAPAATTSRPPATTANATNTVATTVSGSTTPTVAATPTVTATTTVTATVTPTTTTTVATSPTITTTATVTATVTAIVTPVVTATITAVGANCRIIPAGRFGKVYGTQAGLPARIGCPTELERPATMAYQPFAGGFMLYDSFSNRIYVFYQTGKVENYPNPFKDTDPTPTPASSPSCTSQPVRGFGKLWATNAVLRQAIGCPLASESSSATAAAQNFDRGIFFAYPGASNGKRIYVVFNDGTYLDLADTFVG